MIFHLLSIALIREQKQTNKRRYKDVSDCAARRLLLAKGTQLISYSTDDQLSAALTTFRCSFLAPLGGRLVATFPPLEWGLLS